MVLPADLISTAPNQTVAVDCAGPLPVTLDKNTYIIVIQDSFTRFTELIPVANLQAITVAAAILNDWVFKYGPMQRLLSDNGSEFSNSLLKSICATLEISKIFASPFHPQGDGQVERMMATIKKLIASQIVTYPLTWDHFLSRVQLIYNSSVHKATNESPFFLWFARLPTSFHVLTDNLLFPDAKIPISIRSYNQQMMHHLMHTINQVMMYQSNHHQQPETLPMQVVFTEGDLVWLHDPQLSSKSGSKKLVNNWSGPFLILQVLGSRTVLLLRPTLVSPRQQIKVSMDRLRKFSVPAFQPWLHGNSAFKFPLFLTAKRLRQGEPWYKVQWLSKEPLPDSWEPSGKLPIPMFNNFEQLLRARSRLPLKQDFPICLDLEQSLQPTS